MSSMDHKKTKRWKKNKEIFEKLENQITQKLRENEMIIRGDFKANLEINKPTEKQEQSRHYKILQDLITKEDLDPISIKADKVTWTRFEWNNKEKTQRWTILSQQNEEQKTPPTH